MRAAGEATRRRILAVARKEFAEYGFAGARINRIAAQARASKERLYVYFASKEELFAAVCADVIEATADRAQFSADDVPGFVERLFDAYIEDPDIVRLYDRLSLDGTRELNDFRSYNSRVYDGKIDEVRRGQTSGIIDPSWEPGVLLGMLLGIVRLAARDSQQLGFGETADGRPTVEERRAAAVRAAEKLTRPMG